jgi:hypothetical protein
MENSVAAEFVHRSYEPESEVDNIHRPLQFTGNWFIDAGILGFVNLMEEVYGWDLNGKRKNRKPTIKKN